MLDWNSSLYLRFSDERTRPAKDLLAQVRLASVANLIDLGCGPGNSTALLRERYPQAAIIGLDSSADMLAEARKTDANTHWLQEDASTWQTSEQFELVYSNAMLHWLPDHRSLLQRWMDWLVPGGALAFQIPTHEQSLLHQHILQLANTPRWQPHTKNARHALVIKDPLFYYDTLADQSVSIDMWHTDYYHEMVNAEAILHWIRGTGLRPFLEALPGDAERHAFESELLTLIRHSYPVRSNGKVIFPFRRLFVIAYRSA